MSSWLTAYVLSNPDIKSQVQKEFEALLESSSASPSEPLATRIAGVPIEAWEMQLPVLDKCIRETIRLSITGVLLRKNVGVEDIVFGTGENGERGCIDVVFI